MVINKRKKNSRQRGSWTHGWGAKKKHRGAGNRGGKGMSGTGKRGDQKKPVIWKNKKYFGKFGFKKKGETLNLKTINIGDINNNINKFVSKEGKTEINLTKLGYDKLLGTGKVDKKMDIIIDSATKKAIEKVKSVGGEVVTKDNSIENNKGDK